MYLYMHVFLAPSYIISFFFYWRNIQSIYFSSVVFPVVKATVVREELDFGDGSLGLPFPLQKNYTVQYKKRDIFKVIQDHQ